MAITLKSLKRKIMKYPSIGDLEFFNSLSVEAMKELSRGQVRNFLSSDYVDVLTLGGMDVSQIESLVKEINFSYDLYEKSGDLEFASLLTIHEVLDFMDRTFELCEIFGVKDQVTGTETYHLFLRYHLLHLLNLLIKNLKYSVNIAFNRFTRTDFPKTCSYLFSLDLFPRSLTRRINVLSSESNRHKKKNLFLLNTLFQGWKKGMLPMRDEDIVRNLQSTQKDLSTSKEVDEDILEHFEDVVDRFLLKVGLNDLNLDLKMDQRISSNSSFEFTKSDRGSLYFYKEEYKKENCTTVGSNREIGEVPLLHNGYKEGYFVGFAGYVDPVEIRTPFPFSEWDCYCMEFERKRMPCQARPAAILEPFKVRVVTATTSGYFTPLKLFQEFIWRKLKSYPAFRLIGEQCDGDIIRLLVGTNEWSPGQGYCSGDYSAATNKLKGIVSREVIKRLFSSNLFFQSPDLYERIFSSLLDTDIDMTKIILPKESLWTNGKEFEGQVYLKDLLERFGVSRFQQISGQLMGNILSFPILCIANYCAFHTILERFLRKRVSIFSKKVYVNGDDILFQCDRTFYDFWLSEVSHFGFEPSMGKNLWSPDLLQINSQLYKIRIDSYESQENWSSGDVHYEYPFPNYFVREVVKIGFANFGLITNRKKNDCMNDYSLLETRYDHVEEGKLIERARMLPNLYGKFVSQLEGIPETLQTICMDLFKRHIRQLRSCYNLPYEWIWSMPNNSESFNEAMIERWMSLFPKTSSRWQEYARYFDDSTYSLLAVEVETSTYVKELKRSCKLLDRYNPFFLSEVKDLPKLTKSIYLWTRK